MLFEDNRVRSPEPTADWRSEVSAKDTPFFPNQGKEGGVWGLPPLRARINASLFTEASVYLTKVCCIRIAQLSADNKTWTNISCLFDVDWGAEALPVNRGTLLPWGPYSG